MPKYKKEKIAIVIRSFWPYNPAIGEALLLLSESLSQNHEPVVITQVKNDFPKQLENQNRGNGVKFFTLPLWTNSASHMLLRVTDLVIFTGFTFASLIWNRPDKVYVATTPPLFTPLVVGFYCKLFNKKYLYHLQDIHPEITSIKTIKKSLINKTLKNLDNFTVNNASKIVTLTEQMRAYTIKRARKEISIELLANPSVKASRSEKEIKRTKGFIYCGNAGRLQRIPLLLQAIERYVNDGGNLPFVFAGGGIYSKSIEQLAKKLDNVTYMGVLPADQASGLMHQYSYGLMPIEDEVTQYAFPSKSSSYLFSGCHIIAICGQQTSVADWVLKNEVGYVADPDVESLVSLFHTLEKQPISNLSIDPDLLESLTPEHHAQCLKDLIINI